MNTKVTKPHTHIHLFFKDKKSGKTIFERKTALKQGQTKGILDQFVEEVTTDYVIERYRLDYSFDKDGATEYFKYHAQVYDEHNDYYTLTVHVFSCYCEPLNENKEPPF